ncbi:unnamed protein product [Arabis nemorensis]|uniref:F-box domain-containing protein n=1 Tax=Arabis nemorensis TaxID=586526 RepID=A0A565BC94_9BRAS|nr:unnamed protein product [Arabis nemorensis]
MDSIGILPDEVLCHIFSFLTTKEAAITSILSKKWLNLWALVPNIDIDDSVFLHPQEGKRERGGILQSFMDFVDRLLDLQGDSPIKKFSLKCKTGIDPDRVNLWICNVLERGVSELELSLDFPREDDDLDPDYMYFLPSEMFVSRTLVKLKLRSEFGVDWWRGASGTCLPMLKTLNIDSEWVLLCDDVDMFLVAFPVLEEFSMAGIEWPDSDETVSSGSLRKLIIYASGFQDFRNPMSISFDTPNLIYLEYADFVAADYLKVILTSLVEALLDLKVTENQIQLIRGPNDEDYGFPYLRNVSKLMSGIRNVQRLFFSADTLEVLSLCCESMPVFSNLKFLRLRSSENRGWQAMPVLLRNCPHLETLVLEGLLHYVTDKCGDACDCISREDKGRSLLSCPVKKLRIKGFRGTVREKEMIRHFLESFPSLEEMEVYAHAEEHDPTTFEVPRIYKIVANKVHEEVTTEVVLQSQRFSKGGLVQPGSLSQTQMDEISSQFSPRNNKHIYDMIFIMHGDSSLAPLPPTEEMSEDYYQQQLDALNATIADLKEKQRDSDALFEKRQRDSDALFEKRQRDYNALFDTIVDHNPMVASALRVRRATDSEEAKASNNQELTEKKRDFNALFDILAEQNPMLETAWRAWCATSLERAESSRVKEMTGLDQD